MNNKLIEIIEHREYLVHQAAAQRIALIQNLEPWRARLTVVDHGLAAVRYIKHYSIMPIGAALIIAALRPKRAGKLLRTLWVGWLLGRAILKR